MNFAAIDFETANGKYSSACSVGIALVENGTLTDSRSWLIRPEPNYFNPMNISIHGIHPEDVADAPSFFEVWQEVMSYTASRTTSHTKSLPLVAHNASFDMGVLRHALDITASPYPNVEYLCTLQLAKRALPNQKSHRLNTLCSQYSIPLNHHDALSDAKGCAQLLLQFAQRLGAGSIEELRQIVTFGALYTSAQGKGYHPPRLRSK